MAGKRKTKREAAAAPRMEAKARGGAGSVIGAIVLLIVATVAVYHRVLHADFVYWDDNIHIFENPRMLQVNADSIAYFWHHPYEKLYIPISYTVYSLLAMYGRLPHLDSSVTVFETLINPRVFHAANLVLHTLNVLLVYAILLRITRRSLPSVAGALLFALHPLQVESVAWISELRGLLCGLFCFAAILAYLSAVGTPEEPVDGVPLQRVSYWLAIVLTVLALLSKPSAVSLPMALFALDRWIVRRPLRACALSVLPWLLLAILFTYITHGTQPVPEADTVPLLQRVFVAGDAVAFYLAKFAAPLGLTIDYERTPHAVVRGIAYATTLITVAAGVLVYLWRRKYPWLVGASVFSLAFLLPVLGFAPFIFQEYSTVADRYVYIAMLGPAIILATLLAQAEAQDPSAARPVGSKAIVAYCVTASVLTALAVLTVCQVSLWDSSFTLFQYAVEKSPNEARMRLDYGIALRHVNRLAEAADEFRAVIKAEPNDPRAYDDLGVTLVDAGDYDNAIVALQASLRVEPGMPGAMRNLGAAFLHAGRVADGAAELQAAVQADPGNANGHNDYANALAELGRLPDAVQQYQDALAIEPNFPEALFGIGPLLAQLGQLSEAETDCRKAMTLAPRDPRAYYALGNVLIDEKRTQDAITIYQQAVALGPNDGMAQYNLGCALFESGQQMAAIPELQQAVQLQPNERNVDALGIAYAATGDYSNARLQFQHVLTIDPSSQEAMQQLAHLPH